MKNGDFMFGNNRGDDIAKSEEKLDIVSLPYLLTSPVNSYFIFDDSLKFMLGEVGGKSSSGKSLSLYGDEALYKPTRDVLDGEAALKSIEKDVKKWKKKFDSFKASGDVAIAWTKLSEIEEYSLFKQFIGAVFFSNDKLQALKAQLPGRSEEILADFLANDSIRLIQETIPKIKEEQIEKRENASKLSKQANKLANKHTAELLSNRLIKKTVKEAGLNGDNVYTREKSEILADLKEKFAFALDEYIAREWAGFFTLSYLRETNRLNQLFGLSLPLDCKVDPIFMYPGMDLMFSTFSLLEKLYIDYQGELNLLAIEKPVHMEDIAIPLECQPGKPKYENQSDASSDTSGEEKNANRLTAVEPDTSSSDEDTGDHDINGESEFKACSPPVGPILSSAKSSYFAKPAKPSIDYGKISELLTELVAYGATEIEQTFKINPSDSVYCKLSVTKVEGYHFDFNLMKAKIKRALKDFLKDLEPCTIRCIYQGYEIDIQMYTSLKSSLQPPLH